MFERFFVTMLTRSIEVFILFCYTVTRSDTRYCYEKRTIDGREVEVQKCWYNYYEDGGICKECPNGYTGLNCSSRCFNPGYGRKCGSICNCTKERCNHVTGCTAPEQSTRTATTVRQDQTTLSVGHTEDSIHITTTEKQDSGTHRYTDIRHFLLYGLACVLIAVLIVHVTWFITRKVVCSISLKVNHQEDTTVTVNPHDGYEMIDENMITVHIPLGTQHQIFENPVGPSTGDDSERNDELIRSSGDYLQPISGNYPISSDSNDSVDEVLPVLSSDDYLHPYNSLDSHCRNRTHVYNDTEHKEQNDSYINFIQPQQEHGLQSSHKNNSEQSSSYDQSGDNLIVEEVFLESRNKHRNKNEAVSSRQDETKDVEDTSIAEFQNTSHITSVKDGQGDAGINDYDDVLYTF